MKVEIGDNHERRYIGKTKTFRLGADLIASPEEISTVDSAKQQSSRDKPQKEWAADFDAQEKDDWLLSADTTGDPLLQDAQRRALEYKLEKIS